MANTPPFDQRLENEAAAAEQCMKLGAVLLRPSSERPTGFAPAKPPESSRG